MTVLPSGTLTFLLTDVQDSTRLWESVPESMDSALQRHDEIIEGLTRENGGHIIRPRGEGDSRFLVFERALDGVQAAAAIQQALVVESWPGEIKLRVRMGVHTGEGEFRDGDYYGSAVNRCASLREIAYGGQTLISRTTCDLVQGNLPDKIELLDLGKHPLKGRMHSEHIYQLMAPGLPIDFPPLGLDPSDLDLPPTPPPFLDLDESKALPNRPVFVAREKELAHLESLLEKAVSGEGQVFFITGGAGRGKTALLDEFCFQAQERDQDLITARGSCNAHTGMGDPYLPFRDITGMLTGDVEASLNAGTILPKHAKRLWNLLPYTVDALLKRGPSLVDVLVGGEALLARTEDASPENVTRLRQLKELVERKKSSPSELDQNLLFEQFTNVLRLLGKQAPLLLFLDDLQWADRASIDLLNHLGRRIEGHPILILGAYRPDEVALGRDGGRHPLETVVNELKRLYGEIQLDLSRENQEEDFVDQYLDTEPNRLGPEFRQTLKTHTGNHPLFTVELLREMMDREDLILDDQGRWIEGPELSWEKLPARVEAVIQERVERLDDDLREVLSIASVEGVEFTVQVIAQVKKEKEQPLQRKLSQQLEKTHRLVNERNEFITNGKILSRYQFRHQIYQHYLYHDLSAGERRLWHGDIAAALESLHQGETRKVAVQLAHHYHQAKIIPKASLYLLEAAKVARDQGANTEALKSLAQIEAYGTEVDLVTRIKTLELKHYIFHNQGNFEACLEINEALLKLADESQDKNNIAEAHFLHGDTLLNLGNLSRAIKALDQAAEEARLGGNQFIEAKALGYKVLPLNRLGQIEEAEKLAATAIQFAKRTEEDLIVARNLANVSTYYTEAGDLSRAIEMIQQQIEITRKSGAYKGTAVGLTNLGFNYVMLGLYKEAIPIINQAKETSLQIGNLGLCIHNCWNLSLANLRVGNPEEALEILGEVALDVIGKGYLEVYHLFYSGLAREGTKDYAQALEEFQRGYTTFLEMDFAANAHDCLAGVTRCLLQLGKNKDATDAAQELWEYLNDAGTSGMELPILAYLSCAQVFQEAGNMNKSAMIAREGYQLLLEMANKISNPRMRQSYFENVPEHRELITLRNRQTEEKLSEE